MPHLHDPSSSPVGPQRCRGYAKRNFENCGLVSESELKKLVALTKGGKQDLQSQQDQIDHRKKELKQKSTERSANWSNTIENRRIQGERTREIRLMKDEERRQIIDAEEAAIVEEQRRQIMDQAERKLFETNDKVKAFNSHLQTYHTMLEREEQLEVIKKQKELRAQREAAMGAQELATVEAKAQEDLIRVRESKFRQIEVKTGQLQQLHEQKEARRAQRSDGREEREQLRLAAEAEIQEEKLKQQQARLVAKTVKAEVQQQLQEKSDRRRQNKEELQRTTSSFDRDSFLANKAVHQGFLKERQVERTKAKLAKIEREYNNLELIRQAKEINLQNLENQRRQEGVLGLGERMTEEDHKRTVESKSRREEPHLHGNNQKKKHNDAKQFLAENRQQQAIKRNAELALLEEIEEAQAKKKEAKRNAQILLLQKKEKEAQKIRERLLEFEERRQNERATLEMDAEAKRYIDQSLSAVGPLPPVSDKYKQMGDRSPSSPASPYGSPTKSASGGRAGVEDFTAYDSDGSPAKRKQPDLEQQLHNLNSPPKTKGQEAAHRQLLKYSTKVYKHQA